MKNKRRIVHFLSAVNDFRQQSEQKEGSGRRDMIDALFFLLFARFGSAVIFLRTLDEVFEDGGDVVEGAPNAEDGRFVNDVGKVGDEIKRVEIGFMDGVRKFFHCHGKRAQVSQNAWGNEGGNIGDEHARQFCVIADMFEGMRLDLFRANEFNFASHGVIGRQIILVERFVDVQIDAQIGRTRAPQSEDEKILDEIARAQIRNVFGIDEMAQGKREENDEFFGNFREHAHVTGVFELRHLGEIECIEQAFVSVRFGAAQVLNQEKQAGNAPIGLRFGLAHDAAGFIIGLEAFCDGCKEDFSFVVGQVSQLVMRQIECLKVSAHVLVKAQLRIFAQ